MKRYTVSVEDEVAELLDEQASFRGVGEATLLRLALTSWVRGEALPVIEKKEAA